MKGLKHGKGVKLFFVSLYFMGYYALLFLLFYGPDLALLLFNSLIEIGLPLSKMSLLALELWVHFLLVELWLRYPRYVASFDDWLFPQSKGRKKIDPAHQ